MKTILVLAFLLLSQRCRSRSVGEEESVVSVYTTLPTTAGTAPSLDVYHQIANNLAERITSPIYRFFGFNNTEEKTTKRPFARVELPHTDAPTNTKNVTETGPVTNDISDRDVEELSVEALQKTDKKPEKIVLFSSYLPANEKLEKNDTSLELDDVDDLEDSTEDNYFDVDASTPRGPFVYILELIGSIIQLLYGAFTALFRPSS